MGMNREELQKKVSAADSGVPASRGALRFSAVPMLRRVLVGRSLSKESATHLAACDGRRSVAFKVSKKGSAQLEAPVSGSVVACEWSEKAMIDDRQSMCNWDFGEKIGEVRESVATVARARSGGKGNPSPTHHWAIGIHV